MSHLDGHARVVLPTAYAAEHVTLAYAVTVHKAEGLTVDRAVLLADSATTGEHLYVGMSRGRHDNQVCVVTDAATTGHGYRPAPTPVEVLTAVMRRSSAEQSATETLREQLDRSEDRDTVRRLHEQARAYIERCAGPDRRPELRRLRQVRANLPTMRNLVAVNERRLARLEYDVARVRRSLSEAGTQLETLTRRRRFRRPDRHAIDDARQRISAEQRNLERIEKERGRFSTDLERSRARLRDAERSVARIPEVESAITRRRDWFRSHPEELAWEADLAGRLAHAEAANRPAPGHEDPVIDEALEEALKSIDLRTIALSRRRPRTGIEHHLREALGIRPNDPINIPLPPLPGRGIDGPDLGL